MPEEFQEQNLISGFVQSTSAYGDRSAVFVEGRHYSYKAVAQISSNIATTILQNERSFYHLAAVFAHRSLTAYTGVLGVLAAGRGYVPLNPKFPITRTKNMLLRSGCDFVVVGQECLKQLKLLLSEIPQGITFILPETSDILALQSEFPKHRFFPADGLSSGPPIPSVPANRQGAIAYLLFTSGSTGEPKGVPVSHLNIGSYIKFVASRYNVHCEDRVSQMFDLTFDLSVHDMFISWKSGACLYCIPEALVSAPAKYIRDHKLTLWFSVPSVVGFMSRLRLLRPELFPSLRYSLFCGEALPMKSVLAWQTAAPNSIVENLYGPTEATVAFTWYRWDASLSPALCRNGIVPIGWPFDGQRVCIVDEKMNLVVQGQQGELLLGGSQITSGYWMNRTKTQEQYVQLQHGDGSTWYKTGDLAIEGKDGCLSYSGRIDDQVKIRGFRVELQEIDLVLREASKSSQVVSIPWPLHDGSAEGIVAVVCGVSVQEKNNILEHCRKFLPDYMVPREIHFLNNLPLNSNGKVDRNKLTEWIQGNNK